MVEASGKVKELFPNLADVPAVDLTTGGDGGARDAGSEDEEAGELGTPFTETEDDEEWVGDRLGRAGRRQRLGVGRRGSRRNRGGAGCPGWAKQGCPGSQGCPPPNY